MLPAQPELARRCATCASALPPEDAYCGHCGYAQPGAADATAGDRTVLLPTRPGSLRGVAVTGVSIVLVLAVAIAILAVRAVFFTPADLVRSYFDALGDRDADRAWSMLAHDDDAGVRHPLMEADALDDPGYTPPANVAIEHVTRDGGEAVAEVAFDVAGVPQRLALSLERGRRGLFQRWHIVSGLYALQAVGAPGADLRFAGAWIAREQVSEVTAFPGGYAVTLADHPLFELEPATAIAGGEPAAVSVTVHDEGRSVIGERVYAYLDGCLETGELEPEGCPFRAREYSLFEDYTDVSWSLVDYPQLYYEVRDDGSVYVSGSGGLANVTATATSGFSSDLDEDVELSVDGSIIVDGDQVWFDPNAF